MRERINSHDVLRVKSEFNANHMTSLVPNLFTWSKEPWTLINPRMHYGQVKYSALTLG